MMSKLRLFVFLYFLTCGFGLYGQRSAYIGYQTSDGLAQSQVRAIEQDHLGYLWFGTLGGLSRFDGYEFVNFSRSDGLPDNQVNCLLRDGERLLIGSTGAVAQLASGSISQLKLGADYASAKVMCMAISASEPQVLWVGLDGAGLLKVHTSESGETTKVEAVKPLPDTYIRSLAIDSGGTLWIGTRAGLSYMEGDKVLEVKQPTLARISVSDILPAADGSLYVSTFNEGVFRIEGDHLQHWTQADGLISNDIRCIAALGSDELWFASSQGLSVLREGVMDKLTEKEGLPYANIKSLGSDMEGHMWIGTDGKGVLRRAGSAFSTYSTRDGLHSDIAMALLSKGEDMYIGSYDQGIAILRKDGKEIVPYPHNARLPNKSIWQLQQLPDGSLWVGTSQGLLLDRGAEIKVINSRDGLPGNRITALEPVGERIWLGAEEGFALLNAQGEVLEVHHEGNGFEGRRIRSLLHTGKELYIAAQGRLYRYAEGGFDQYLPEGGRETALYCLEKGIEGEIWVGTSDGLFLLRHPEAELEPVDFSRNFNARNINFLRMLEDSTLIMGTNNGLYRLRADNLLKDGSIRVKQYTAYEGLESNETNQNAVLLRGDELWFGTIEGAVRFLPYSDPMSSSITPRLLITGIQVFNEALEWTPTYEQEEVEEVISQLQANQNYLSFQYSGIYMRNPEKLRYRYRLQGADDEWLGPTTNRSATYAYLPHGKYRFEVEAYSEDSPEARVQAGFSFVIEAPFYLRTWFFVALGLLALAVVYLVLRYRLSKERQKRANLKLQYQSRMLELESQSLNASMNRHFIFNALNSIQYYINMQDRVSANRYLTRFARLIRKNLDSSLQSEGPLSEELDRLRLYLDLESMRFEGRFTYSIQIDEDVNVGRVNVPAMMLQPFLENSIWHGILPLERDDGELRIEISRDQRALHITITDNGVGYETSLKNKNLDGSHESKGMEIARNRMALFGQMTGLNYQVEGPEEIIDDEGKSKGTRVRIILENAIELPEDFLED